MSSQDIRPKWWRLYLIFPLLVSLFLLDGRLNISLRGHMAVQIGILLIVYRFVHWWLMANKTALSKMDQRQYQGTVRLTRIPPYRLAETIGGNYRMLHLPGSEIKGVLSDTFEMGSIDAELLPLSETPQDMKKD